MQLTVLNFSTLVERMAAAVQGAAAALIDLTVGSVLRAILEANASIALWMQWLIVQVLAATRLATSTGGDCDSFGADFGFARLPAVAAAGGVTLSRYATAGSVVIAPGTGLATMQNAQAFLVVADTENAAFDAALGGYVMAAGVASVTASVVAALAGSAGNVQANTITLIASPVAGVDVVTNQNALTGGVDAESDAAFKLRFGNYLASLSKATNGAIGAAIGAIQQGLSYSIQENIDQTGAVLMGNFVITVDDGSGAPPPALLGAVQGAVDAVRPVGTSFAVQAPQVIAANVTINIVPSSASLLNAAIAAVGSAVAQYIGALPVGATMSYTRLAQIAYDASAVVSNLSALKLNGAAVDIVPTPSQVVRAGMIVVS
ncbi:baseplate J/gp47 family protein [Acidocella sp.]|uniref:baseplate J/gp47 family protein n=1 Tax=Acidocella sp. TaxID=50710 RepID=UPI002639FC56|nr:baseplate J/gp47 family protein [Acidocella sp.]